LVHLVYAECFEFVKQGFLSYWGGSLGPQAPCPNVEPCLAISSFRIFVSYNCTTKTLLLADDDDDGDDKGTFFNVHTRTSVMKKIT